MAHPPSFSIGTQARLIGLGLTKPRGDILWDGVVRGTGVVALLAIVATVLLPRIAPLIGFLIVTVWVNGPIGMVLPATYEPILMAFGRVYPPLLVGTVGIAGTIYVEYLNYRLYAGVLGSKRLEGVKGGAAVQRVTAWFKKAPFLTVWLCSWSPLPYWSVRILSPLAGYPVSRHLLATFVGRFPRLVFFAALGVYWNVDLGILFALSGVAVLAAIAVTLGLNKSGKLIGRKKDQPIHGVEPVREAA